MRGALALNFCIVAGAQDADVYRSSQTTVKGCKCKSGCETSALKHCNTAEFCSVEDKNCEHGTAEYSLLSGHYDYCTWEPFEQYERLSAKAKYDMLMSKAQQGGSGSYPNLPSVLLDTLGESIRTTFDSNSDTFPDRREKTIHGVGVIGGIKFESAGGHPYQGLFKGAEHGMIRFSSAKNPSSDGVTPGMGLKFFRDGRRSANFVSMYSLDGQPCSDTDFFQHDWSNHIPMTDNFGLKIIAAKFWQVSNCPLQVGLSDVASDADGVAPARGSFPYELKFKAAVSSECDCQDYDQCLSNLASISAGTKLFDVEARPSPHAALQHIGTISLTSQVQQSKWGDEQFFIQHQNMEDDFAIHPEWVTALDLKNECGMEGVSDTRPTVDVGCSSPFGMLQTDSVTV